jgi:hypothetical protein
VFCLKDVFRAQEAPSINSLCRPLYVLGLGVCLYSDKLKWNEAYPHKLVAAWARMLLTILISAVSWLLANITIGSFCWFRKCDRKSGHRCLCSGLTQFLAWFLFLSTPHHYAPMKSVGTHARSSLLFVMRVIIWHFVSNTYKVLIALILMC